MDPGWYKAHVLPLLANARVAAVSRTVLGRIPGLGELVAGDASRIAPAYLNHLASAIAASEERSRMYCGRLAGIAVFDLIDPIDSGWLDRFLIQSRLRERLSWVRGITQTLRASDQQAKDSTWDRWLHRYLERRAHSNPIPLDAMESGVMSEWALVLQSHYADIVDLLLVGPPPTVKGEMFYYRLHEAAVLDEAPAVTARFLTALHSQENGNSIWDWEEIHSMVARLIELNPAELTLRPLC